MLVYMLGTFLHKTLAFNILSGISLLEHAFVHLGILSLIDSIIISFIL